VFCVNRGTETPDGSQFCRKCGHALGVVSTAGGAAAAVAPAPAPVTATAVAATAKPKGKAIWFFLVVLILLVWWIATSHSPGARQLQQLAKQQHTLVINQQSVTASANGYYYFKLDVPPGSSGAHLQGSFTASGGSGNDIEAYVLSETDFVNWKNGHPAKTFYNSGKVTTGNININLPAEVGTCYLVFDNKFSLLSQKNVQVNATLTYYQ